ncbi:MAG: hypothetical protein GX308_08930 [Epulopiscium sp.]|nr:hypothetical protein [Candidatus Epulonipiscium sp.]
MKKFASLKWASSPEDIVFQHKWIKDLPSFLKDRYILKKCPIQIKEVSILKAHGYEVVLPVTREEVKGKSPEYIQNLMDKTIELLKENKVIVINPPREYGDKLSYFIKKANGNSILPIFILPAIIKAASRLNKDLKYVDVTIIDGQNAKTDLVLDILYPQLNYLNIVTSNLHRFKDKSIEIYEDVGLNLQISSHNKKMVLGDSDIIIDCTDEPHIHFYHCKRNAVYFYIGNDNDTVKNILLKREDLIVIDDFILSVQNKKFTTSFCKMIWYVSKPWLNKILSNKYDLESLNKIAKDIKRDGWKVEHFCQYGNIIKI